MDTVDATDVIKEVGGCWRRWHEAVASVFHRPEPRLIFEEMTGALLADMRRKNGWTLSERAGRTGPGVFQTFLCRGAWDPQELIEATRQLLAEDFADPGAALVIDDTQFLKKGTKSVGVAHQHYGPTNGTANCQTVVTAVYIRPDGGHCYVGHRLYLPIRWAQDPQRRCEAHVPKEITFATKLDQAIDLVQELSASPLPFAWVLVDGGYGQHPSFRRRLTATGRRWVAAVRCDQPVLTRLHRYQVQELPRLLGEQDWEERSCGDGAHGARFSHWAAVPVELPGEPAADGFEYTLLLRRTAKDTDYWLVHAPVLTSVPDMITAVGFRWSTEEDHQQGKQLIGMAQHQVRTWPAFQHYMAVCLFTHALLSVTTWRAHHTCPPDQPPDRPPDQGKPAADPHSPNCGPAS